MAEEKKEQKEVMEYKLVNISTQQETVIQDPSGEIISMPQALVELLNLSKEIYEKVK